MTIQKPVKSVATKSAAAEAFIAGAPDAAASKHQRVGVIRGKKEIISVGFAPDLLRKIDAKAADLGISRAALINLACSKEVAG